MTRRTANRLRKELGISIYELSKAIGVKGWKIQDYESGYFLLGPDDMELLIKYLEIKSFERKEHENKNTGRILLARGL